MTHFAAALFSLLLLAIPAANVVAADLADEVESGEIFTKETSELFNRERYSWVERDKVMRFPTPSFSLFGMKTGETIVEMKDGKVARVRAYLHNRGDDGAISDDAFRTITQGAIATLDGKFGAKRKQLDFKPDPTSSYLDVSGLCWDSANARILLEYALKGQQTGRLVPASDYLRLTIYPAGAEIPSDITMRQRAANTDIKRNATALGTAGRVITNIPMVDQGNKGYCAAAAVARILNYYGYDRLDQHQIALWAKSDAQDGTSNDAMMRGIRRVLQDRYKLVVREFDEIDGQAVMKILEKYNEVAKKEGRPPIILPRGVVIDISTLWSMFAPVLLKKARASSTSQNDFWMRRIKEHIDKGIPVIWSVVLGCVKEEGLPQAVGGHMRLIIGYDDGNIIYSDTWGAGHERKTMPLADAISITTGLKVVSPRIN